MRRLLFFVAAVAAFGGLPSATYGDPPPITVDVDSPVEATSSSGADVPYHVIDRAGLDATCTPDGGPGQDFSVTAHFPIGDSTISCSDGTNSEDASVTVQDTTPPSFGPLPSPTGTTSGSSAVVSWTVTAADVNGVSDPASITCSPASGSSFNIGSTAVTCTATDTRGNPAQAQFNVVVSDTGAPSISVIAPGPAEATGPGGAVVNYTVNASDNSGVTPTVTCGGHEPGTTFPLGTTSVTCTATDAAGNHTSTSPFNVTVQDTTPPVVNVPSNITVEADSSSGKVVTYSASATDLVSGTLAATCAPASGSTFPLGTTTVNCSATDGAGKTGHGSFSVTVTDTSAPTFAGVPADRQVEANGPGGSIVNYTTPTATDATEGPIAVVSCSPASGSMFPLGTTTVTCSASDSHGNVGHASFHILVADTTPPTLTVPSPTTVYATTPTGIPETNAAMLSLRAAASASDIVDPHPRISDDLGSFAEVGTHEVVFLARDASGNAQGKTTTFTVLPQPPAGTPPLPLTPPAKPPADVPKLQAFPGDGSMRLVWGAVQGAARYVVYRSENSSRRTTVDSHGQVVYSGTATRYTDRGLSNGVEYRYVVVAEDAAGNQSAGVAIAAVPRRDLLRSPKDGAKLRKPPKLMWARNSEAAYYNVQLFRGEVKILSTWPVRPAVLLKRGWKYEGHRYKLGPGVYHWYVWPGFGARSAVDYGEMLGSRSFQIVR